MSTHVHTLHYVIVIFWACISVVWKKSLTWNVGSLSMIANLYLAGPLLKANCPITNPLPMPSSRQHNIYLHTDDINKPLSSRVGHGTLVLFEMLSYCSVMSMTRRFWFSGINDTAEFHASCRVESSANLRTSQRIHHLLRKKYPRMWITGPRGCFVETRASQISSDWLYELEPRSQVFCIIPQCWLSRVL